MLCQRTSLGATGFFCPCRLRPYVGPRRWDVFLAVFVIILAYEINWIPALTHASLSGLISQLSLLHGRLHARTTPAIGLKRMDVTEQGQEIGCFDPNLDVFVDDDDPFLSLRATGME